MTVDLDQLETLARAATQGPWIDTEEDDENFGWGIHYITTQDRLDKSRAGIARIETDFNPPVEEEQKANATFIAAANPAVVLELVAELRAEREKYANAVKSYKSVVQEAAWLAFQVYKPRRRCPPLQECNDDDIVTENDCQQCWLNAARDAGEKEAKE